MMNARLTYAALFAAMCLGSAQAQSSKYPPIEEYLMPQANEIALAKSAAPANISGRATIKVLTRSGYEVAQKGDNGSVCTVMRGFSAPTYTPAPFRNLVYDPTVRAPICFTPQAVREVLPYYELRTQLAMQGKNPDEIAEGVQAAYAKGELPKRTRSALRLRPCGKCCPITNCERNSLCRVKIQTRSPKVCRPPTRKENFPKELDLLYASGRAGSAALLRTANATRYAG